MLKRLWLPLSLLGVLAIFALIALFLAHVTLHPVTRPLPADAEAQMRAIAAAHEAGLDDVEVTAPDGVPLRAWRIQGKGKGGNRNAVILLHGAADNRAGTVGYAQILIEHGYDVLMPDARAHGASGGRIATYGVVERGDIRNWFEWLEARDHPHCIYGFGESMGGAQLLAALDVEPHFCAVVADSSFSNFHEIAYDRLGQPLHLGPWVGRTVLRPVVEIALAYTRSKYHLDLASASPEDAVARTRVPVMLIHGQADRNIPVRHSRRIWLRNPAVVLWEVPGAGHCGALSVRPQEFKSRLLGWYAQHNQAQHPGMNQAAVLRPLRPPGECSRRAPQLHSPNVSANTGVPRSSKRGRSKISGIGRHRSQEKLRWPSWPARAVSSHV
ncbi:MAG: alpha/beta fold hydrolase [Acidobacteria bacterium]|nr:alpha/beta fold hydrolase [Acidobacteriota bacterium]